MVFISKLLATALLGVSYVAAAPIEATPASLIERASGVIIGYRTVSSAQAQSYNKAGTVTFTGNVGGTQTGSGVYTSPNRGGWLLVPTNPWYCVIFADPTKLSNIDKAWIPATTSGGVTLWFASDAVINNYITGLDSSFDPFKTLRLSQVSGETSDLQMSIPQALLGNGGLLGITTYCVDDQSKLPNAPVSYSSWTNVQGSQS